MSENKLNRLERSILAAEDSADDARWLQAEQVVRRLNAGETGRAIAASWTNLHTGQPYNEAHVSQVAKVWRAFGAESSRKAWATAYASVEGTTRSSRAKAQAPDDEETAKKLGANLAEQDPAILTAVLDGYNDAIEEAKPAQKKKTGKSLNERWQAWLNQANTVLIQGARLENQTEEEDPPLDTYAEAGRLIYQRMTEKKIDAEIRQLFEEVNR